MSRRLRAAAALLLAALLGAALAWITLGPAGAQRIAHCAAKDIAPERRP